MPSPMNGAANGPSAAHSRPTLVVLVTLALISVAPPAVAQLGLLDFFLFDDETPGQVGAAVATGDFNGDGFDDLAVGRPGLMISGQARAGAVNVFYGGLGGWSFLEIITPTTLDDEPAVGTALGSALAVGDFDDNGYDDLAIGMPGRLVNFGNRAGAAFVLYGNPDSLGEGAMQFLNQLVLADVPEDNDRFGSSLAAGDLSGDGVDDLAIGVPLEDLPGPLGDKVDAGAVNIIYGSTGTALILEGNLVIHQDTPGVGLNANADEMFGFSLAIGQVVGNFHTDLAVGVPGAAVFGPGRQGEVVLFPGGLGGIDPLATERVLSQIDPDILGTAQDGDEFGFSLAIGNFDGDLWPDLAIGVPGESELGTTESGAVQVLYGNAIGVSTAGDQFFVESSFDPDVDAFDRLGEALAVGDFNADGRDDLAIGAPLDNSLGFANAGEVDVLYGTRDGLAIAGGQVFNMIFFDTLEIGDEFGTALATGHFFSRSDTSVDLAVGVPLRGGPINAEPGAMVVIRTRSIFSDDFETGDDSRWSMTSP